MGNSCAKKEEKEDVEMTDVAAEGQVHYEPSVYGPVKNRSCTDIICCLLFLVFVVAFLAVGFWAYAMGDPRILLYPTDSSGNICGLHKFSDRPYVFYFDLMACVRVGVVGLYACPTPAVCVEKCPTSYYSFATVSPDRLICKYDVNVTTSGLTVYEHIHQEDCAAYYLDSTQVAGRCFPKAVEDLAKLSEVIVNKENNTLVPDEVKKGVESLTKFVNFQMIGEKVFQDLAKSWIVIIVFLCLAAVVSYILIILMRWIAGPIVLLCGLLFIGFFTFAVVYCFKKYFELKESNPIADEDIVLTIDFNYYINLYQTWLTLGIIAAILLGISLLVILFLRKRILIAIAIFKESSRAVAGMMFTLLWPIVPLILQIIVIAYWLASELCLASTGTKEFDKFRNDTGIPISIPCDPDSREGNTTTTAESICTFIHYGGKKYTIFLQVFQLFVFFWVFNFVIGLGQMTLAGAFAAYYWAFDKSKDVPLFPLTVSFWRCVRYHPGSLAFGSLILAIVQVIRVVLEFIDRRLKGAENRVAKFFVKCLKCCFWCLEKFIKFLNRNAYIMVAVSGKNFCTSAKNAFSLILRNFVRAAVLDSVTDFLLFLCKLFVVGGVGVLAFYFFSGELADAAHTDKISQLIRDLQPRLNYYLIPVGVIVVGTFIIACVFFSVYSMAVDTLFLCFLEDLERNDGSAEKPYYMSKGLLKVLGKKNAKYKEIKSKVRGEDNKDKKRKKKKVPTATLR